MIGFSEILMALMFTMFGGTSGNEALDYVDADLYFKSKGIEMTVESMMLEAKKPDVGEESFAKEASVRRLLAIRTLGEMKDKKALPVLNSFIDSKEMFVSDYAIKAIARIEGKPLVKDKKTTQHWKNNLVLLPKKTGVVVNLELKALTGKAGLAHRFKAMKGFKSVSKQMEKGVTEEFYPLIDRVGNVRIDNATFAIPELVGNKEGWVVAQLNGEYDKQAIMNFFNQDFADEFDLKLVEKTTYFMPEDEVAFAFQDNHSFTFAAGPNETLMPLSDIQKAIDSKNKTVKFSDKLQKLIEKTNKEGNLWASGLVTGEMLNVPHIKEFETFRISTGKKDEAITIKVIGEGKGAKEVKETMATLEKMYVNFKDNELKAMKDDLPKSMQPMIKAYESLQFKTVEKEGIIEMEIPSVDPLELMFGMFMGIGGDFEDAQEDQLPIPDPLPAPVPAP